RKDPEAAVSYYDEVGFPAESVNEYILTLLNSNFEDWRRANQNAPLSDFPFNLKKMSASGALFDFVKLTDVSKNVISKMPAQKVFELSYAWAKGYNPQLASLFEQDEQKAVDILNIDREGKKPRKDIAKWSDVSDYLSYMYDETFTPCFDLTGNATPELAVKVLEKYKDVVNLDDDKDTWFARMKELCPLVNCTPNVKEYKSNPEAFDGHVGDVSTIVRVALTGRTNTPDLYSITKLLGESTVQSRLSAALEYYREAK
ncbi:MAG: glutamate--tRNA ligase, partial [Eubacterium sp.]